MHRFSIVCVVIAGCGNDTEPDCQSWHQWGNDSAHAGVSCVGGQPLERALADVVYDAFMPEELTDAGGDLIVHYQSPLIDKDDVYMMAKTGTYTPCKLTDSKPDCFTVDQNYRLNTQVWTEKRYHWDAGGNLVEQWSFDSDWKPEPAVGFEPMFQPALVGTGTIVIPAAGGEVTLVNRATGRSILRVKPFGDRIDPDTYVAGGIAVGPDGSIYYNAIKLDHDAPYGTPSQAFLVAIDPDGNARTVDYAQLVPHAPAAGDMCVGRYTFQDTPLPWPPLDGSGAPIPPPSFACGPQRPGINTTPAIGADGTIFVVSRAHFNSRYSFITALDSSLAAKWSTSLRDHLMDGCGVRIPSDGTETDHVFDCRVGAPLGVEPATGLPPAGTVDDDSSSSPVALPDGGVLYGAFTGYNGSRGHLMKFAADGTFVGAYDFGWDSTPAVAASGGDYKIVVKDNHYNFDDNGVDAGPYFITELDSSLKPVWKFQSTETQSCVRQPDGSMACVDDHPHGFEWCINAPAVDRDGVVYVNSEDGHVYAIGADGQLRDRFFLDSALGAAYTPLALDSQGRVFALNAGHMAVVGRSP